MPLDNPPTGVKLLILAVVKLNELMFPPEFISPALPKPPLLIKLPVVTDVDAVVVVILVSINSTVFVAPT